jgi:hypothetical protein
MSALRRAGVGKRAIRSANRRSAWWSVVISVQAAALGRLLNSARPGAVSLRLEPTVFPIDESATARRLCRPAQKRGARRSAKQLCVRPRIAMTAGTVTVFSEAEPLHGRVPPRGWRVAVVALRQLRPRSGDGRGPRSPRSLGAGLRRPPWFRCVEPLNAARRVPPIPEIRAGQFLELRPWPALRARLAQAAIDSPGPT